MDTSKEYILMCEKAFEIQQIASGRIKNISVCRDDCFAHRSGSGFIAIGCKNKPDAQYLMDWLWLPRQDQLQQIALDKIASPVKPEILKLSMFVDSFNCLLNKLAAEDAATQVGLWSTIDTLEKVWLIYVMKYCYKKQWNPIHQIYFPIP